MRRWAMPLLVWLIGTSVPGFLLPITVQLFILAAIVGLLIVGLVLMAYRNLTNYQERSYRTMKNVALVLSVFLLGCSHSMTNAVQAQAGFTNAEITGNYAWAFGGRVGSSGTLTTTIVGTGRVFANGAFNGSFSETMADITSNKITVCSGTISGGYSVNADGTGTATINTIGSVNQTGPGPCGFISPIGFNFVMLNQGHVIAFSSNDGNNSMSMTMQSQ